jgi:hypothetical protein
LSYGRVHLWFAVDETSEAGDNGPMKRCHLLVVAAALLALHGCRAGSSELPASLAGVERSELLRGERARQVVEALHGRPFPEGEHLVGRYGGDGTTNVLYVTIYPDQETARRDLLAMSMALAGGVPPFAPLEVDDMGGHPRFRTEGLGARHLFYRVERRVVWLQWEPATAAEAEADLLGFNWPGVGERDVPHLASDV